MDIARLEKKSFMTIHNEVQIAVQTLFLTGQNFLVPMDKVTMRKAQNLATG